MFTQTKKFIKINEKRNFKYQETQPDTKRTRSNIKQTRRTRKATLTINKQTRSNKKAIGSIKNQQKLNLIEESNKKQTRSKQEASNRKQEEATSKPQEAISNKSCVCYFHLRSITEFIFMVCSS